MPTTTTSTTLDPVAQFQDIIRPYLSAIFENNSTKSPLNAFGFFLNKAFDTLVVDAEAQSGVPLDSAYKADLQTKIAKLKSIITNLTPVIASMQPAVRTTKATYKKIKYVVTTTSTTPVPTTTTTTTTTVSP